MLIKPTKLNTFSEMGALTHVEDELTLSVHLVMPFFAIPYSRQESSPVDSIAQYDISYII